MNKMTLGHSCVAIGMLFLIISITFLYGFPTSEALWGISFGISMVLNFIGTTILLQFINAKNRSK
ncbi:hypothetical protein COE58_24365 [Bacillus cereus]|nr:hypothetical protein COE58_24365 [Bacillus cereus]